MAHSHDTMMKPGIEGLLSKADSKFSLVTLAARRARNINSYFNQLVDAGAHVIPVMTAGAERFIGATTLSALASEPVKTRLWDDPDTPIPHTQLGQSADLVLVAPATARIIAAYRAGLSTDLLTNVL